MLVLYFQVIVLILLDGNIWIILTLKNNYSILYKLFDTDFYFFFRIDLLSTPRTVLGKAIRVECELVNVCACLNKKKIVFLLIN